MPSPGSRGLDLCKTILSGAVLEYPTPHLLHWSTPWDRAEYRRGYSSEGLVKLVASLEYLQNLPAGHERDLVVIVDPESLWFQLRPNVLLERYHAVTKGAERRLEAQINPKEKRKRGIQQRVLFGATKECGCKMSPKCCSAAPDPPLPGDMYGKDTDTKNGWTEQSSFRPRFLDTGFVMGPASDVLAVLDRARNKRFDAMWNAKEEGSRLTDQTVLSLIFAEQEQYRAKVIKDTAINSYTSWPAALLERLLAPFTWSHSTSAAAAHLQAHQNPHPHSHPSQSSKSASELGIHLDYTSSLSHSMAHSSHDALWLRYSTPPSAPSSLTPADCTPRLTPHLPDDIQRSRTPGANLDTYLADADDHIALPPRSWAHVTLYTDMCTGSVPAAINHNDADGHARGAEWRWLWSARFAKGLLTLLQRRAAAAADAGGTVDVNVGGAWLDGNKTHAIEWFDLCEGQGFDKDLFVPWS